MKKASDVEISYMTTREIYFLLMNIKKVLLKMNLLHRINFLFRPKLLLLVCLIAAVGVDIAYIWIWRVSESDLYRDIMFAVATGVTASALLIILTEMANNFRNNRKRWFLLSDLFWFLSRYEINLQKEMGTYDEDLEYLEGERNYHKKAVRQKKETKSEAEDFIAKEEKYYDESHKGDEKCSDYEIMKKRIVAVYDMLPQIIELIENTYNNYKSLLTLEELDLMDCILFEYRDILSNIKEVIEIRSNKQLGDGFESEILNLLDAPRKVMESILPDDAKLNLAKVFWNDHLKIIAKEVFNGGAQMLNAIGISLKDVQYSLRKETLDFDFYEFHNDNVMERIIYGDLKKSINFKKFEDKIAELDSKFLNKSDDEDYNVRTARHIAGDVYYIDEILSILGKLLVREPGYGRSLKREWNNINRYGVQRK